MRAPTLLSLLTCCLIAACGGGRSSDPGQVAIRVNEGEVSVHQVDAWLQRQGVPAQADAALTRQVLQGLVDQELLAQAAVKDGLDRDPAVIQQLELARREVLARVRQERVARDAAGPSSDEVDRYINRNPALFDERRLYTLTEVFLGGEPAALAALRERVRTGTSAAATLEALRASGLQQGASTVVRAAEDVPLLLLEQLARKKDGEAVWMGQGGQARVLVLMESRKAPVDTALARRQAQAFLLNERKRERTQAALQSLRDAGKVEYQGRFSGLAAAAAPPPSAAPGASR